MENVINLSISKILNVPMYGKLVDGDSTWEDETFSPDVVLKDLELISRTQNPFIFGTGLLLK